MTSDQAPSPRPQAPIWHRPHFWFVIALLVRLPAIWFHDFWNADTLGYLYLGAALVRGRFSDFGGDHLIIPPGATPLMGIASFFPPGLIGTVSYLMQCLLSAAWVYPLYSLILRRHGVAAAAWGAALAALIHPLVGSAAILQATPFYILVLLAALAALESESRTCRQWALILWPAAALGRGEGPLVVLLALLLAGMRYHRSNDHARRTTAILSAILALLAVCGYAVGYHQATGDWPFLPYFKNVVGIAVVEHASPAGPASDLAALIAMDLSGFITGSLSRLPGLLSDNIRWWWLGALPGALALLFPALLAGIWLRLGVIWRGRRTLFSTLDALDGMIVLNMLIFLMVWRSRHHVPMVLVPLLPCTAAGIMAWHSRRPKWLIAATALSLLWAGAHLVRNYAGEKPENFQPACRLGQRLGAPAMSNDIVGLDCAGRDVWLGQSEMPFLPPDAPATHWEALRLRFPTLRFAIHNANLSHFPPPPSDWPQIECLPGINEGEKPVCAYRVPQ